MTVCTFSRRRILKCISAFVRSGAKSLIDHEARNSPLFCKKIANVPFPSKGPWSVLFFGSDDFALDSLKALHNQ